VQGTIRLFAFWLATFIVLRLLGGDRIGRETPVAPTVGPQPPQSYSTEDVAALVRSLGSDRYLDREAALKLLEAAARQPKTIDLIYPAMKVAASDVALAVDVRLMLKPLVETARYTWLLNSTTIGATPAPSSQNLARWIDQIAAPGKRGPVHTSICRDAAERELLDALTQPATVTVIQPALEAALAREALDGDALNRLRRLDEWSRPGLATEFWQRRRNLAVQYFVLGLPARAPGAVCPTQFDQVVGDMARCVSGNSLAPGEYPLNVAFPHPREQAAFFQLVSLPTARDRVIYQYENDRLGDIERLQAITERTLGPSIATRHPLDEGQMWLLGHLDQPTLARLLRQYFAETPDRPFDLSDLAPMLTDVSSCHRAACLMLALDGSHDVIPTLVEAAEKKQFLLLDTDQPQGVPWAAALAIAARDRWDEVDVWLAGLIERTDQISYGLGTPADVGATAAAMLLKRNGEAPADFELLAREPLRRGLHDRFDEQVNANYRQRMFEDRMFKQLGVKPYYFADARGRSAVQAWWKRRQPTALPPSAPNLVPLPTFTARAARP
jgi:hypothetical protein